MRRLGWCVRRQVLKLCRQEGGALMVGHSLNHDLMAMRLNHQLVIDTALLFQYKGLDKCTPSLADLALQVLGKPIRVSQSEHDSMEVVSTHPVVRVEPWSLRFRLGLLAHAWHAKPSNAGRCAAADAGGFGCMTGRQDAATSMDLVLHALQHGVKPVTPPEVKVPKEMLAKLFLHNLPAASTAADLTDLFARVAGCPVPTSIEVRRTHPTPSLPIATDAPISSHAR